MLLKLYIYVNYFKTAKKHNCKGYHYIWSTNTIQYDSEKFPALDLSVIDFFPVIIKNSC